MLSQSSLSPSVQRKRVRGPAVSATVPRFPLHGANGHRHRGQSVIASVSSVAPGPGASKDAEAGTYPGLLGKEGPDFYPSLLGPFLQRETTLAYLGERLYLLEQPFTFGTDLNAHTRCFIVKLKGGGLLLYGCVAPTPGCLKLLSSLGEPVKHIVAASNYAEHYLYIPALARALPGSTVWLQEAIINTSQGVFASWLQKDAVINELTKGALKDRTRMWRDRCPPEWGGEFDAAVWETTGDVEAVLLAKGGVGGGRGTVLALDWGVYNSLEETTADKILTAPSPYAEGSLMMKSFAWVIDILVGKLDYLTFVAMLFKADIDRTALACKQQQQADPTAGMRAFFERVNSWEFDGMTTAHWVAAYQPNGRQRFDEVYARIMRMFATPGAMAEAAAPTK